jgi:hypothetical protein
MSNQPSPQMTKEAAADADYDAARLEELYAAAERKFAALAGDVHLPFLEVKLYRKYFIQVKTEHRLDNLGELNALMQRHRLQTLRVLKLVHEREQVMARITAKALDFAEQRVSTLDVQTQVLQLLHAHQQVTLKIVEGVTLWREALTRPYPFHWNGGNYLAKVLDDCAYLDECELRTILPLRVEQFPLCSNIASLGLFGSASGGAGAKAAKAARGGKAAGEAAEAKRLRDAEGTLFAEPELQAKLMRELEAVSASGYFVPLLNMQRVIPNCFSGIRVSNKEWNAQLSEAILDVREMEMHRADDAAAASPARDDSSSAHSASTQSSAASTPRAAATPPPGDQSASRSEPPTPSPTASPTASPSGSPGVSGR